MKRLVFCVIILSLVIGLNAYEEWTSASGYNEDWQQAFGLHFGNVSGNGFAYRYFLEKVGFQAVLGGYSAGNNEYSFRDKINAVPGETVITKRDKGRRYSMNFGANVIYPLKKTDLFTFYATGGLCWKYFTEKFYNQDYAPSAADTLYFYPDSDGVYTTRDTKNYVNVGLGPGVEIKAGKYFKLCIELPITYTGKHEFIMYVPAVGIYYYFR